MQGDEKEDKNDSTIKVEKVSPHRVKEIKTEVKKVRIISGQSVATKTVCRVHCRKVAIYF